MNEATTEKRTLTAQFPISLAQRLAELAQANDRSLSAEMRRACLEHLERESVQP